MLEGHSKKVSCCEFDVKGNMLASYSAAECSLRIWKAGNAGFFSTIMGGTNKSYREVKLKPLEVAVEHEPVPMAQAHLKQSQMRVQQLKQQTKNQNKCRIRFVNNDKAIELIRENGQPEYHQLAR